MRILKLILKTAAWVIAGISAIIILLILSFPLLADKGYIPLTEEYDRRIYMKKYKNNKEDFDVLIDEISSHLGNIPPEIYDEGDLIIYDHNQQNWDVSILKDYKHLYEYSIPAQNIKSIENIENVYNTGDIGISYIKNENSYAFHISEWDRIVISDDGVKIDF